MIEFEWTGRDYEVRQATISPIVYLDVCALMDIAVDTASAERLVRSIKTTGGTLALSLMHLLEFARVHDSTQIEAVSKLLRDVHPHLALIHSDPGHVVRLENECMRCRARVAPHLDMDLLRALLLSPQLSPIYTDPKKLIEWTRGEFFEHACTHFMRSAVPRIRAARERASVDNKYKAARRKPLKPELAPSLVRHVFTAALDDVVLDAGIDIGNSNNWRDIYHLIVPLAYADLLVLDAAWYTKAEQYRNRIRRARLTGDLAECYPVGSLSDFSRRLQFWTPRRRLVGPFEVTP